MNSLTSYMLALVILIVLEIVCLQIAIKVTRLVIQKKPVTSIALFLTINTTFWLMVGIVLVINDIVKILH